VSDAAPGYSVHEGERYAKSPITGEWYRVTKWEDRGDGQIRALEKEPVDESEVPAEVRE